MKKFNFKITTWEEIIVSDDKEQEILDLIKEGAIQSSDDIYNHLAESGDMNVDRELIVEGSEQVSLLANGGYPTIEVREDIDVIWDNSNDPDYFPIIDQAPKEVQDIVEKYAKDGLSYQECKELVKELRVVGWTCDYGLDAVPYKLKPIR